LNTAPRVTIAVIGAGPVGLALALHASKRLPHAALTVFDARPADRDVGSDPRTLALSLGSLQFLQRLGVAPGAAAEPIVEVQVSQAAPSLLDIDATVRLSAGELGVPQLGAVLAYGALLAPMQQAWLDAVRAQPARLASRFGEPVAALDAVPGGVSVRSASGSAQTFDLAIVAEGGVFADQARKAVAADYAQTAWVGTVTLRDGRRGVAFERFTRHGPAALLPLPSAPGEPLRAALVWCVASADDPVRPLDATQRLAVLNTIFPREAGRLVALSPLKDFALGLNAERTLVRGRTVCIGNAAQTLHPVAGQGLNLGLRDAHALVAGLHRAAEGDADLDAALRRIEWARAGDRWSMIATTDFLARGFTWKLPGAGALRGLALAGLQNAPRAKAWLGRQMMFGWR
jgi:2-octaprenyl-6-methoxyphenol hydroxylase